MIYSAGERPTADEVQHVFAKVDLPSLGREAGPDDHRLELLAGGLTFEMRGLAPGAPAALPAARHFVGMADSPDSFPFEAISLEPVRPAAGEPVLPLVKVMAEAAALLALGSRARAVGWWPAGSWIDAAYFVRAIESWRSGGPFPALGLAAIHRRDDGSVVSDGLAFFTGQELLIDPRRSEHATDTIKLAVRAVDHLVREGRLTGILSFLGRNNERLEIEPMPDGRTVRLGRGG